MRPEVDTEGGARGAAGRAPAGSAAIGAGARLDADRAWEAVVARDRSAADAFVYAVTTTGVYCRPGCASRRPKRANVRFFAEPSEAEDAGFRACKRCRPDTGGVAGAVRSVEKARAYLDAHLDRKVTLEQLSRVAHLSPFHLQRTFRKHVGLTPREYVEARRAAKLRQRLREGEPVARASWEAGYTSTSRLYEGVDTHLGMTPSSYRRGGLGATIHFTIADTRLGGLLVAATERGVCAIALGDDPAALEAGLRAEYPRASVEPAAGAFPDWLRAIVAHVEGETRTLDVPLDLLATTFQWRVWSALRSIPYGSTLTYGEVARRIGRPGAARAVASACAANRVALAIPCHRVVRGDGAPGGYRWGSERKRRLLALEAEA